MTMPLLACSAPEADSTFSQPGVAADHQDALTLTLSTPLNTEKSIRTWFGVDSSISSHKRKVVSELIEVVPVTTPKSETAFLIRLIAFTCFGLGLHPTNSHLIDCGSKRTDSESIWTQDVFVTEVIEFTFLSSKQISKIRET